jgi:hypothetical protein
MALPYIKESPPYKISRAAFFGRAIALKLPMI